MTLQVSGSGGWGVYVIAVVIFLLTFVPRGKRK